MTTAHSSAALLPLNHPSPRLLGSWDDGTWVARAFELVEGRQPGLPWTTADLDIAVALLDRQALVVAPPSLPDLSEVLRDELNGFALLARDPGVEGWIGQHVHALAELESGWVEASHGDRWLHNDSRGDNMLLLADGTGMLVDWPWSARGNPAFDAIGFVPAAVRDGALDVVPWGTSVHDAPWQAVGEASEQLFQRCTSAVAVSDDAVSSMLAAFAGLMEHRSRQPPPPSMPTVRAFQASQGAAALAWLRVRTGLGVGERDC